MASGKKNTGDTPDLDEIRKRINEVDEQIQNLISERARHAQQVGVAKGELGSAVDYYRPEREAEVLRAVVERNKGPLRDEEMLRLFREIMSACLAQQEPLKIGFLGPEGTFTQTAVFKHFGHSVRALPFHTIDEVFQEVESGVADFGQQHAGYVPHLAAKNCWRDRAADRAAFTGSDEGARKHRAHLCP